MARGSIRRGPPFPHAHQQREPKAGVLVMIYVRGLSKHYDETFAVRNVSFTVERGEIFGILGPDGAGKTTIVECIEGLRRPDAGTIRVLGLDPQRDRVQLRRRLAVSLQSCALPDRLRVDELLELFASFYPGAADPASLIELFGLAEQRQTPYGMLGGSQRQRLSLAIALVGKPEIVVLDEITADLDDRSRRSLWELIEQVQAAGVTILLVTADAEEAERLCHRVALVDRGRLIALDSPTRLVARAGVVQRIRFRPMAPLDLGMLTGLPDIRAVRRRGEQVVVTGTDEAWRAVTTAFARRKIVVADLRLERADLGDALAALVGGHRIGPVEEMNGC